VAISIDGELLPAAVWQSPIELDPGAHRLTATGIRIAPYDTSFEMTPGQTRRLALPLVRIPLGTLLLSFRNRPAGLSVAVDTRAIDPGQVDRPILLPEGPHKVAVSAPGYLDFLAEPTLKDQKDLPLLVSLNPAPRPRGGVPKAAVFVAGGSALAVLALGIGFGAKAQTAADGQLVIDPLQRDLVVRDGVRSDATIANVFFGISGVLGLTTTGLALATHWRTPPAKEPKPVAGRLPLIPVGQTATAKEP
jgi:hypothetical protein